MTNTPFLILLVGLAQYFENQQRGQTYPYPDALRYSINNLAQSLGKDHSKTLSGLFQLMRISPLKGWYPWEPPSDFDSDGYVLDSSGLTCEAIEYLDQVEGDENEIITTVASLASLQIMLDNQKFRELRQRLLQSEFKDQAQWEYVQLRCFLIQNPFTTREDIEAQFMKPGNIIHENDVADLYTTAQSLSYRDSAGKLHLWTCERCGPLYVRNNTLGSVKPSICNQRCPRHNGGWKAQPFDRKESLVLREGVHLRISLPGIPELRLFQWLLEKHEENPDLIDEPELYPNLDTYDIRISFKDEVWAVDVKDIKDPYQLGKRLTEIENGELLHSVQAFYVYPEDREVQRPHYREIAMRVSERTRQSAELISDEMFKSRVAAKLAAPRKKGK